VVPLLILLLASLALSTSRALLGIYLAALFCVLLSLGATLLLAIGCLTGADWLRSHRAILVSIASWLKLSAVVFVICLIPSLWLFPWFVSRTSLPEFQQTWYHPIFFLLRTWVYLGLWVFFSQRLIVAIQTAPPGSSSPSRLSAAFLPVFGFTFWLSQIDWVMSFSPDWQTTLFAFYRFSNLLLAVTATLVLLPVLGLFRPKVVVAVRQRSRADLARFLLFAGCLWAYGWFCLYMLIWYAGVPEEQSFILRRLDASWPAVFWMIPVLCWLVPFSVLLGEKLRQIPAMLALVGGLALVGSWLDTYLMVFPNLESFVLLYLPLDVSPTLLLLMLLTNVGVSVSRIPDSPRNRLSVENTPGRSGEPG
jgi:hypothetical protein